MGPAERGFLKKWGYVRVALNGQGEGRLAEAPETGAGTYLRGWRYQGIVTRVVDGDTIQIETQEGAWPVRLVLVDAPEMDAPTTRERKRARKSQEALARLILCERVVISEEPDQARHDRFGRELGYVWRQRDMLCANAEMVASGRARVARSFPGIMLGALVGLEERAAFRLACLGKA